MTLLNIFLIACIIYLIVLGAYSIDATENEHNVLPDYGEPDPFWKKLMWWMFPKATYDKATKEYNND